MQKSKVPDTEVTTPMPECKPPLKEEEQCYFCKEKVGRINEGYSIDENNGAVHTKCLEEKLREVLSFDIRSVAIQKIVDEYKEKGIIKPKGQIVTF